MGMNTCLSAQDADKTALYYFRIAFEVYRELQKGLMGLIESED